MRKKIQTFLLILIITSDVALGKSNKTKSNKTNKKHTAVKENINNERVKRALNDDDDSPFWPNRGKKPIYDDELYNGIDYSQRGLNPNENLVEPEEPFWGNRGRRELPPDTTFLDYEYPESILKNCEHCVDFPMKLDEYKTTKYRREDFMPPFWGTRGRRHISSLDDLPEPFWGNRGRRMQIDPFWGMRSRGIDVGTYFTNKGRREEEPFWGNRGRRKEMELKNNRGNTQNPKVFWGSRGRKADADPFWGTRGRREENDPFWGNRGRREEVSFWGNLGRQMKPEETEQIATANGRNHDSNMLSDVKSDMPKLSMFKKEDPALFWGNGKEHKFSRLISELQRSQNPLNFHFGNSNLAFRAKNSEAGTVLDNRMYVDEPKYILVERTGRSSGEEDPYYISRGKKYYLHYSFNQAARDRRGAIEEIVKSVRNDPYYIARGKKNYESNSTSRKDEFNKTKNMICAAIDFMLMKENKVKRDINDNERDRRTTLKKLAAQLQVDPYFVSRGKKSDVSSEYNNLDDFINNVAEKCN